MPALRLFEYKNKGKYCNYGKKSKAYSNCADLFGSNPHFNVDFCYYHDHH
jgi:hypothetical protein